MLRPPGTEFGLVPCLGLLFFLNLLSNLFDLSVFRVYVTSETITRKFLNVYYVGKLASGRDLKFLTSFTISKANNGHVQIKL